MILNLHVPTVSTALCLSACIWMRVTRNIVPYMTSSPVYGFGCIVIPNILVLLARRQQIMRRYCDSKILREMDWFGNIWGWSVNNRRKDRIICMRWVRCGRNSRCTVSFDPQLEIHSVVMYLCHCMDVFLHDRIVTLLCRRAVVLLCQLVLQARDQPEIRSTIALSSHCHRNVFVLLHCCVAT